MARVEIELESRTKLFCVVSSETFKTIQGAMAYVENQNTANEKRAVCLEIPK